MAATSPCAVCGEPRPPETPCGRCLFEREPPPVTIHHGTIELHEEIGGGAMGTVFRGRQVQLGRDVAVKVVPPTTPEGNRSLLREASAMASLQHPNILPVLDVGEEDSHAYIVMPLAPGGTLAAQGPLDEHGVISIGGALADALAHAHQRGVIHCDIKPENVLLDADGRPLLADFSIARVLADARTTAHNRGTPYFVAPEVLAGGAPDASSDVFSLGVLLHYLRHGKLPSVGSAAPATRPLDVVIARAMEEDPARRHASAGAMRDALRALEGRPSGKRSRVMWEVIAWLAALACAAVIATYVMWPSAPAPSLIGAWHMRSEPIDGRGSGSFVVEVTNDGDAFVMDYRSGLMRCTFTDRRCEGTWYGRSGDGWFHLDLAGDGTAFVGRWGYRDDRTRSAEIRGTRFRSE